MKTPFVVECDFGSGIPVGSEGLDHTDPDSGDGKQQPAPPVTATRTLSLNVPPGTTITISVA